MEFLDALKADDVLLRTLNSLPNVDVITSARTTQILGDGSKVTGLEYEDRTSGDVKTIELAGVFVQIGLLPNTEWLEGALERNQRGEIVIDERGTTSAPESSPPVTAPLSRTSRSSSRWGPAPPLL